MLRTKKTFLILLLSLLLASLALCAVPAFAAENEVKASGACGADGENLTWTLTYDGVLTVSGSGQMDKYYQNPVPVFGRERAPWYEYRTEIAAVVLENGVESVGEYAFYNCSRQLTVQIPQSLRLINENAFNTDGAITAVYYMAPVGQFGSITVKGSNDRLLSAQRHSHVAGGGTSFTQQQNFTAATCTAAGGYDLIERCQYCQLLLGNTHQTIPPKGHTPGEIVIENEAAATCYAQGRYDRVVYCADCGAQLSRNSVVIPAAHGETAVRVEKTWDNGFPRHSDVTYCTVCGGELSRAYHTMKLRLTSGEDFCGDPHDLEAKIPHRVDVLCMDCRPGGYEVVLSSNHIDSDDSGSVIQREYRVIAAPTCTSDGVAEHCKYCIPCNDLKNMLSEVQEEPLFDGGEPFFSRYSWFTAVLPALGHDYDGGVITTPATCAAEGVKTFTCRNDPSHVYTEAVPATGHPNAVTVPEAAATATEHGHTEGVWCPDCETWLSGHEVIHNTLGERVYLDEYTEDGERMVRIQCTVCGGEGLYAMEPVPSTEPADPDSGTTDQPASPFAKAVQSIINFFLRLIQWFSNMSIKK